MIMETFFSILFLLVSTKVSEFSCASLQYGDRCVDNPSGAEMMCNAKESLTCQNGTCLCSDMSRMTYDPSLGLCVGLAGHECVNHPTEAHLPNFRKTHCVAYASCENYTCSCWSAFYQDERGYCSRRRDYLQQCRSDYQCDGRKGFICKDALCQCDSKMATYNPELERCVGLPNQPCTNQYRECVENHKCKLGVCVCKYKEIQSSDGTLKCDSLAHKYGKNCGKHRGTCGSELHCINGKCRCPNPDYQVYDYDLRMCVSLVGGPCTVVPSSTPATILLEESPGDDGSYKSGRIKKGNKFNPHKRKITKNANGIFYRNSTAQIDEDGAQTGGGNEAPRAIQCIPYARCLPYGPQTTVVDGGQEMGRCECDKGYIETKKGKCNLPFNAPCDTHSKNKKDICDESVPLYCVNNVCSCKNSLDVYEDDTKRCKRSIGSLCWKDASCVNNARCVRYSPRLPGRCMCPQNTQPDESSTNCILAYDVDSSGYEEEDDISLNK